MYFWRWWPPIRFIIMFLIMSLWFSRSHYKEKQDSHSQRHSYNHKKIIDHFLMIMIMLIIRVLMTMFLTFPLRHKRHNSVVFVLMIMIMIVMSLVGTRLCNYVDILSRCIWGIWTYFRRVVQWGRIMATIFVSWVYQLFSLQQPFCGYRDLRAKILDF